MYKKIPFLLLIIATFYISTAHAATYGRSFMATTTSSTAPITPSSAWINAPIWSSYYVATSTTATSNFLGNLTIGSLPPLLNGFGTGLYQFLIASSSNDVVGGNIVNTSAGPLAASGLFFENNLSPLNTIGLLETYYGGMAFSGSNWNGPSVGLGALPPNSLAVYASDGALILGSATSTGRIDFYTGAGSFAGGVPDMKLDSNGNLGVSTSTPWAKLSITNTGTAPSVLIEDSASPDDTPFVIDASGNMYVGTLTPQYAGNFVVQQNVGGGFGAVGSQITNAAAAGEAFSSVNSDVGQITMENFGSNFGLAALRRSGSITTNAQMTGGFNFIIGATAPISFYTGGTAVSNIKMTLTGAGNFGIGTTSPWGLLSASQASAATGAPYFVVASTTGATNGTLFVVGRNGNVGIGTTSPQATLGMQGSLGVNSSQLFLAANGLVGIGTSVPTSAGGKLSISDINSSNASGIFIDKTSTDAVSFTNGLNSVMTSNQTSGAFSGVNVGYYGEQFIGSSNTQNWTGGGTTEASSGAVGIIGKVEGRSTWSGTVSNAASLVALAESSGTAGGIITNWAGLRVLDQAGNSTTTKNMYGVYINNLTKGNTSNYGIYQAGGSNLNYFGGSLGIGTTSPFTALGVAGTIITNNINATSSTATSTFSGAIKANDYYGGAGGKGFTGTCTIVGLTSITVEDGLITSCQ